MARYLAVIGGAILLAALGFYFSEHVAGLLVGLLAFAKGLFWRLTLRKFLIFVLPPLLPVIWRQWGEDRRNDAVERIKRRKEDLRQLYNEGRARWELLPPWKQRMLKPILAVVALCGVLAAMAILFLFFFFAVLPFKMPGSGFLLPFLRARVFPILARLAAGRGLDDVLLPQMWKAIPERIRIPAKAFLGWGWRKIIRQLVKTRRLLERNYRNRNSRPLGSSKRPAFGIE